MSAAAPCASAPAPALGASSSKPLSLPAALLHSKHPRALLHELHLLAQLLYKSNAQFRSAKWVQGVRAIRRCGKRIFGTVAENRRADGQAKRKRRRRGARGDDHSKENGKATQGKASERLPPPLIPSADSVFGKVQRRADALVLLSSDGAKSTTPKPSSASSDPSAGGGTGGALRLRSATMGRAAWQVIQSQTSATSTVIKQRRDLRAAVQDLIMLLRHLVERATASYAFIAAHLNTPPAPTFAPLATTLLGVCAQCGSAAGAWADALERIDWDRDREEASSSQQK
ncbi:hypothetical protein OC835_005066 [Tilletia horrida]|nr:hypothetical protein OC835_005066 [Tilletia horrida]